MLGLVKHKRWKVWRALQREAHRGGDWYYTTPKTLKRIQVQIQRQASGRFYACLTLGNTAKPQTVLQYCGGGNSPTNATKAAMRDFIKHRR